MAGRAKPGLVTVAWMNRRTEGQPVAKNDGSQAIKPGFHANPAPTISFAQCGAASVAGAAGAASVAASAPPIGQTPICICSGLSSPPVEAAGSAC